MSPNPLAIQPSSLALGAALQNTVFDATAADAASF
jgi:hypothetical protein